MRKTTDGKGFAGAVTVTILVAGFMFLLTGAMLTGYFGGLTEPFATGVILFAAFSYLAVAAGVIIALFQRWKEIKGGEEDEAKNTDGSFWPVLFTLFFAAIMVLMAVSVLLGLASGEMSLDNLSGSGMDRAAFLLNGLKSFVLLGIAGWAFWMGWKEVRKRRRAAQARWWQMGWKTIAAFLVFALIAALGFAIRIESDSLGEWLLIYALYLLAACLVLALPCFLIYSLGKSLGEREMEQEERNEAKKY